jgi:molecular chaperone HscA
VDELLRDFVRRRHAIERSSPEAESIERGMREQSRAWKELLFRDGKVDYLLVTGDGGTVDLTEFLVDDSVQKFANALEAGLRKSLEALDDTYLDQLAHDPARLNVLVTGGSAPLPMVRSLANGVIEIRGFKIMRQLVNAMPEWMTGKPREFVDAYLQLAVAIGGAADELPETMAGPDFFAGARGPAQYVPGRLQVSGT